MSTSGRKLFYALPPAWRYAARRLYYLPLDTWQAITGQRDALTPPKGMIYTGGGDFRERGQWILRQLIQKCALLPQHRVLDAGSGIGRMAIPLTTYLDATGSYEGFDVVQQGVDWCRLHIASRFPNFNFHYAALNNDLYRTNGSQAMDFRFPYADADFDVGVVNSVFTHMLPGEVQHYLSEMHRVLRPGGYCYATFFLYDEKTDFPASFNFSFQYGHYRLMDDQVKSANVAFRETDLLRTIEGCGLRVHEKIYGNWRGAAGEADGEFQDILILEKSR